MVVSLYFEEANNERYNDLKSKKKSQIFSTYKSIYITSATIALKLNLSPLKIKTKHEFIQDAKLSENERIMLNFIALTYSKDINILENSEEIFNLTDKLANAGFEILYEEIAENPGDRLKNLVNYTSQEFWDA
jgi:hypothetical protein